MFRLRRMGVTLTALGSCLLFAQCSWFTPAVTQSPGPSQSAVSQPPRTLTDANLIKVADLPPPIGGGKLIEDHRNARSLDHLSICQSEPLTALRASAIKSRSFRARYPRGERPFPRSSLDDEPDSYAVALQFQDPTAAQRAKWTYQSWLSNCAAGMQPPKDVKDVRQNFDWTPVAADPAQAEVAEISYRQAGSASPNAFFESVGLTVLQNRMMITVHLFYADESLYSLDLDDDEAGFAHPQLGLIAAAAKRLSR
jgi:hypothetical protein